MAIGHLNYLDLSPEKRAEAAAKLRAQLRMSLNNPTLTPEQRAEIQDRMKHLNQWVAGTLPQSSKPTARKPQHHSVTVAESVKVKEKA